MGQRKNVKLEDIAEELGVSIVTVSNALKGKKGVSESTRTRILSVAEKLGYHMELKTKNSGHSYVIGVIVAERYVKEFPSFYLDIYKYIAQDVAKRGHLTVLEVVTPEKEMQREIISLENGLAGVILIGEFGPGYFEAVRDYYSGISMVYVDYYDVYDDMDYIVTDGFGGMEQMTRMLIKAGYRNLIFVGSVNATKNITDRYLGFCKALEKAGIEEQNPVIPDRDFSEGDYRIDVELPDKLPEGFVCNCDRTALLLMEKLRTKGIRIPEDVAVVGFDGYPDVEHEGICLSTYRNDGKILAHISVNTLLRRIEGRRPAGVRIIEGTVEPGGTVENRRKM